MDDLGQQVNIDKLEDIKDKIDEASADMEEKREFFIKAGQIEDEDQLLDELDELEAEMEKQKLEEVEIPTHKIGAGIEVNPEERAQVGVKGSKKAIKSEEDELKELESLMA